MLDRIFDMDNPLMRALSVVADLIVLNVLTMLCSLPLVTAGAAYTALNDVIWHIVKNEEGYIVRSYFRSFRRNFKQGSLLGIIFLLAGIVLLVDLRAVRGYGTAVSVLFYAMGVLWLAVLLAAFALLSRYENTVVGTLKNALSVVVGCFPFCAGMLVWTIGYGMAVARFWGRLLPLVLLMGVSLLCYGNALLYVRIFDKLDRRNENEQSDAGKGEAV